MAQMVRTVVVDPSAPGRLVVKEQELLPPRPDEATVRVTAISLNRGEVRRALTQADAGARPGWDFAGIIERAAADGGLQAGTRVVGLLPAGAWAERVNVSIRWIAALPDGVGDAPAATLPVAGLTALHGLRQGGLLVGRKVLVDGASGGVGHFACQLAAASGALVWGQLRQAEFRPIVAEACGDRVVLSADLAAAAPHGPFHLILDSIGGNALAAALTMLAPGGTCVHFGTSQSASATIESNRFFQTGGVRLYGLSLFHELRRFEPAAEGLALLAGLVARGALRPHIAIEAPWGEIASVARKLLDRNFAGKAVLHVD
jgi:NADPH:quinone reductase